MICTMPARDFRMSLGLDPAADSKSRGIEEHLALLDVETGRFAVIMRFLTAQGKVAAGWAYAVGDKRSQASRQGSLVPLYGASGFSTLDDATAEATQVLNLSVVPENSDNAYWFFTARRADKKAQDQYTIGLAQYLLKGNASHNCALAAYTTVEGARAGAASYRAKEDLAFRVEIHDIREDTLVAARNLGTALLARLALPGMDDLSLAAQCAAILESIPVVVDPVPARCPQDYPLAVSPSFDSVKAWADKTARLSQKCRDEKIRRVGRSADLEKLITTSTHCECGKPAVFACVTCRTPICLGCSKNGRCSFCRGE